jgi:hypothetical protein
VEQAADDSEVDGVNGRCGDPHEDLAGARLGDGNVDDLDRIGCGRRRRGT